MLDLGPPPPPGSLGFRRLSWWAAEADSGSRDGYPSRLPQNRTYAVRIRLLGTAGC